MIQNPKSNYLGIDAGGTFTDFVLMDGQQWRIHKVLSTPDNPAKAILQGINELGLDKAAQSGELVIVHGSTVATNAALERKGARTLYIANTGFADLLTIGRQARQSLYDLSPSPEVPPVPRELCLEIDCRRDARGELITPLCDEAIGELKSQALSLQPEAIAINLLFSFLNDEEEKRLEQALSEIAFVSRSSNVLPKYKEYERGIATWLNASLGPKVQQYMQHLAKHLARCLIAVMQSSGGTMALDQAAQRAVNLLLSGPAGGLAAIRKLGQQIGQDKLISFDMGGTSTDVALMDGDFVLTDENFINTWPVAVPMLDMTTIGAGGGSIAWLDEANMLHVGPQSAGSQPGPACYGRGGKHATVTDANLVLGRLQANDFLGGQMALQTGRSLDALEQLARQANMTTVAMAEGIIRLAEQQMVQALQAISIKKGHDPSGFTLCCFGGAGGMHVCSLAEQMNMRSAIVPRHSGVLSALGMLCAPKQRQFVKSFIRRWDELDAAVLNKEMNALATKAKSSLQSELSSKDTIQLNCSLDLRYAGQSYCLNVPASESPQKDFERLHEQQYGHTLNYPVELVNICVEAKVDSQLSLPLFTQEHAPSESIRYANVHGVSEPVRVINRDDLDRHTRYDGPLIITEHVSTTWVHAGWSLTLDNFGNLLLEQR